MLGEGEFPCFTQIFVENVAISFQIQWILDDLYETKKFLKNFKKAIDKRVDVWYNLQVAARERCKNGSIAQLGEHLPYKQRVIGSSPIVSTI